MISPRQLLSSLCFCLLLTGLRAEWLAASAAQAKPLPVGATVPAITLLTPDGSSFDLNRALGEKPTLLIIFRGGWCPYCSQHLSVLAELEPKLVALGVQIIAVSTDNPKNLRFLAQENKLQYQLLSDRGMAASAALGVAYRVPAEMQKKYAEWEIDVPPVPSDPDHRWLPIPAAFVINRDRVIKFVFADPDYTVRISGDDLMSAVQSALK
jgi:peroxiredoxin